MNRNRNVLQESVTRTKFLILLASCGFALAAVAQDVVVTGRGPHHAVWQRVSEYTTPYARKYYVTNSHVELATSMHYQNDQGNWLESKPIIELFPPEAAIARQGPMQVIFPANARTAGGLDVSVDGKRFRSHVIGIAYAEADTGRAVLVAELQDSIAQLVGDSIPTRSSGRCARTSNTFTTSMAWNRTSL